MPRPTKSALLLVHPPGWAPPAATRFVSASHTPPRVTPHSSRRPSWRPSQPVPVEKVVAAGLPLTEATGAGAADFAADTVTSSAQATPVAAPASQQSAASAAARKLRKLTRLRPAGRQPPAIARSPQDCLRH